MNINLDNYEQWLLLYVDNELSAAERSSVEQFLREYPYLQQELDALQQTMLPVENILFADKSNLLKQELSESELEKMLLQLDGELDTVAATGFQKNIADNTGLQKTWTSLQKTKLNAAEIIPFPDKQLLYKKERRGVVRMPFIRWAAAAAVIGLGFYLATTMRTNTNTNAVPDANNIVVNTQEQDSSQQHNSPANTHNNTMATTQPANNAAATVQPANDKNIVNTNNLAVTNTDVNRNTNKQVTVNKKAVIQNNDEAAKNDQLVFNNTKQPKSKSLPQVNNGVLPETDIAALPNKMDNNSIDLKNEVSPLNKKTEIIDINTRASQNAYAQTASYAFEENSNSVLMMDEENITRSKAGIFFKKIKRNIERRAIKPGKSLRIAGFELAVK